MPNYSDHVTHAPAPVAPRQNPWKRLIASSAPPRVVGLDIARGVAVFGMIAAHLAELEMSFDWTDITTWGDLANGRSSILFALLAGISIAIMTGRTQIPTPEQMPGIRLKLLGRGITIFFIGLLLEQLGTAVAVILTFYGVLYVIAIPFVTAKRLTLVLWSVVMALLGPALFALVQILTLDPFGPGLGLVLQGVYSVPVWVSLMLAGMVIGRLDLTRVRTALLVLVTGVVLAAIGYGAGAAYSAVADSSWEEPDGSWKDSSDSYMPEYVPGEDLDLTGYECEVYEDGWLSCVNEGESSELYIDDEFVDDYDSSDYYAGYASGWEDYLENISFADIPSSMLTAMLSSEPHSGGSAEILGSGGFAMALVGFFLLVGRWLRWPLLPVAAMGSMPLTAYSAQILVIFVVAGPQGYMTDNGVFWGLIAGLLVGCTLWMAFFGRGPLERLTKWVGDRMASDKPRRVETPRLASPMAQPLGPPHENPAPNAHRE